MNKESHEDQRTQRTELKEKCMEKFKAGSSYWNISEQNFLLCFMHLDNNVDISLQLVRFHYLVSEYAGEKYFCGMRDYVHLYSSIK